MGRNITERATRFLQYMEIFEFEKMRAMCTDTASVWHNDGTGEQALADKLEQLKPLVDNIESLTVGIVRQFHDSNEILQQNVLGMAMKDGSRSEIHAATYFRFDGLLIDRMEEYRYPMPVAGNPTGSGVRVSER